MKWLSPAAAYRKGGRRAGVNFRETKQLFYLELASSATYVGNILICYLATKNMIFPEGSCHRQK